jgi:hypothetical protein
LCPTRRGRRSAGRLRPLYRSDGTRGTDCPSSVDRLCHLCQPTRQSRDITMP